MAATSFTDLREMMQKVDALAGKLDAAPAQASPAPMLGQMVEGAMAVLEQRIARFEQQFAQHEQRMANLALEVRAAIPVMPDFGPLVSALAAVAQKLDAGADRTPADPPGLAALSQGTNDTLKAVRELCARMDKPIVREGVADLPSGQVKLRITETRAK
jgi:hypothetical protein